MAGPDRESVAAFLADPETWDGAAPEIVETHAAQVFLTADRAWKLRRAVDLGFLDYGTREQRRAFAEAEIARNAPHAPGLYLGLAGVADGPRLIPPGQDVPADAEPLVAMRRFPGEALFDRMAAEGRLDADLMRRTGRAVAAMHRAAEPAGQGMRLPEMARSEAGQLDDLAPVLGRDRAARLGAALQAAGARLGAVAAGRALRRCHGDLHLGNIVLWQGEPTPFDCIEFNDAFSDIDPLYDLAFLLMDLRHRRHGELCAPVLNAWADGLGGDAATALGGLPLLAFYMAARAAIRAKTHAIAARSGAGEGEAEIARSYADEATALLETPPAPRLIAVGGLSGSGKSTLAAALAARLGAVVLRSDAIRKALAGVAETEPLPPGSYTPEAAERTYAEMRGRAATVLDAGLPAILDATHLGGPERAAAADLAASHGRALEGLWLEGAEARMAARLKAREGDASDATPAVLAKQTETVAPPEDWIRIDADRDPAAVAEAALAALAPPGPSPLAP